MGFKNELNKTCFHRKLHAMIKIVFGNNKLQIKSYN